MWHSSGSMDPGSSSDLAIIEPVDEATDSSQSQEDNSSDTTTSLLSVLRCPVASDLARKRKIPSNPPKGLK